MGEWRRAEVPWYATGIMNCSLCGKMIPGQAWVAAHDGREHLFCGPACEDLFISYWLPRYGAAPNERGE